MVSPNLMDAQRLSEAVSKKKSRVLKTQDEKLRVLGKTPKQEKPRSNADRRQAMYGKGK